MYSIPRLKRPTDCTAEELREFERLVRRGFSGSDDTLPTRIRDAELLAFQETVGGGVVAVAGLKQPHDRYTGDVFARTGAEVDPAHFELELGWVFVVPDHRRNHLAKDLCGRLVERASGSGVFATTRPDNLPMIGILQDLGFVRTGEAFLRRGEELALFIRGGPVRCPPGLYPTD